METEPKHPLFDTEITGVYDWRQWKEAWKKADQFELLHSLLHFGFELKAPHYDDDRQDRVLTYMAIADGHSDVDKFLRPGQKHYHKLDTRQEQKQALARKAFEVLCLKVFRVRSRGEYTGGIEDFLSAPGKVEALLDFFRAEKIGHGRWSLRNSGSDENRHWQNAKEFLLSFICHAWYYNTGWDPQEDAKRSPFRQHRPRFVEILAGLGELDLLLPEGLRVRKDTRLHPDDACLSKLEEIAMRVEHFFPGDGQKTRCPKTLEEALYKESRAARTLIILRILQGEQERFDEIVQAQREQELLERKLRDLKS